MNRFGKTVLALVAAALFVPTAAEAQRDSRYTRDANRHLALAMTRSTEAERRQLYEQAKSVLTEGVEREPDNAQIYLLLGQAEAGLGNFEAADAAFRRAEEMHPPYAEEIAAEREAAWILGFQQGVEAMNAQQYEEAIRYLEAANLIYPDRPEAYMNLGSLYAHFNRYEDAEHAMREALRTLDGPLTADLDEEQRAQWREYHQMTTINLAQMMGGRGVEQFQAEQFEAAAQSFRSAAEVNPHSRDYWFNLAQSLFARTNDLRDQRDEAASPEIDRQLVELYGQLEEAARRYGEFDPANDNLHLLIAQAHRGRAEIAPEADRTQWQQRALAALEAHQAIRIAVDEVAISMAGEDEARVRGVIRTVSATPGEQVQLRVALLAIDGSTIAEQTVSLAAPDEDVDAEFTVTMAVSGEIAGWKYEVLCD
jgi:tetratricopeptide (TPR) repeat protein